MVTKFSEYSKKWLESKKSRIKYSTYCAYENIVLNYLDTYFDLFDSIDEKVVGDFFYKYEGKLSGKSIKGIFLVLRMIFKDAGFDQSIINKSYSFRENRYKVEVLSKNEHKKLLNFVESNFTFINLGFLITLSTGIRIGEVCALKWSDIDLDNNLIHINKTLQRVYVASNKTTEIIIDKPKTAESIRDIPITNLLKRKLKPLIKIVNLSYYVISNSNPPIEPRVYRTYFHKTLEEVGIRQVKFHCLRHTFATRCVENSNDYKSLSAILGHSSISITLNLYVHPNDDSKKKCIDKMMNSLSPNNKEE